MNGPAAGRLPEDTSAVPDGPSEWWNERTPLLVLDTASIRRLRRPTQKQGMSTGMLGHRYCSSVVASSRSVKFAGTSGAQGGGGAVSLTLSCNFFAASPSFS